VQIPKPKDKKKSKTYYKNKAMKLWGEIIHRAGQCAVCGKSDIRLEAHHLISRAVVHLRNEPLNGILLCTWHHKYSPECSPHAGPIGFTEWLAINRPEAFEWVREQRFKGEKPDYKGDCERLKNE
jgi:hypothetical protein